MDQKFAEQYIDKLLRGGQYRDLVAISHTMRSSKEFDGGADDYGLPPEAFVFVETLHWLAVGVRSGAWEYYSKTERARQITMNSALRTFAPRGYAGVYELGMKAGDEASKMEVVDRWIAANDASAQKWLLEFVRGQKKMLVGMMGS